MKRCSSVVMALACLWSLLQGRVAAQRVLSTAQPTSFAAARTFSTSVEGEQHAPASAAEPHSSCRQQCLLGTAFKLIADMPSRWDTRSLCSSMASPLRFCAAAEDVVKEAFVKQQTQFRQYLQGLASVPIPLNPDDDKAVVQYADAVRKIREKYVYPLNPGLLFFLGQGRWDRLLAVNSPSRSTPCLEVSFLLAPPHRCCFSAFSATSPPARVGVKSFSEKLTDLLESAEEDSETVRSFLEDANVVRKQYAPVRPRPSFVLLQRSLFVVPLSVKGCKTVSVRDCDCLLWRTVSLGRLGIEDTLGVESLMYAALDSVEKKLGKPLTTSDPQGLAAFQSEVAAVNSK